MCLVSDYADAFADELIRLNDELGVSYFKWDAISQYGCDDPGHNHGNSRNSEGERADCYAFEIGRAMCRIVDKLCAACPEAIVDFDITEGGRYMGLGFLSSGKYFLINNGPYYWSLNMPKTADGNPNMYFYPGPARSWVCRTPLGYDSWIPSVLFLSHYLPDDPAENQRNSVASLVLGQNGIWGDLLALSEEGIARIGKQLARYKQVRDDVTESFPVRSGPVGGSPEVHEKINPKNGRGLVSVFAGAPGTYTYVTRSRVAEDFTQTDTCAVTLDSRGRAIITARFEGPGGDVVFFGA
jgi:alpha-galactosidase